MEQLLALLESIEWYQSFSNSGPSCPSCGNMDHWGHDKDCLLSFYIRELQQQQDIVDAVPYIEPTLTVYAQHNPSASWNLPK